VLWTRKNQGERSTGETDGIDNMSLSLSLMLSPEPGTLIERAAEDLSDYVSSLFGVTAQVAPSGDQAGRRLVVGTIHDPHVRQACADLPKLSEQG